MAVGGKTRKSASKKNVDGKSRKLNDYFVKMLDAKKRGLASFTYKGSTYVRKMNSIRDGAKAVPIYKKK